MKGSGNDYIIRKYRTPDRYDLIDWCFKVLLSKEAGKLTKCSQMLDMLDGRSGGRSLNISDVLMGMWLRYFFFWTWLIEDSVEHFIPAL